MSFEYRQRRRLSNLSGCCYSAQSPSKLRNFPSCLYGPPSVPFCAHCPLYCHWTLLEKSLIPSIHSQLLDLCKHFVSLLFSGLNRFLCLSSYGGCSRSFIIFVALCWTLSRSSLFFLNWGTQNWAKHSRCDLSKAEQKKRIASLNLLSTPFLVHPRIP